MNASRLGLRVLGSDWGHAVNDIYILHPTFIKSSHTATLLMSCLETETTIIVNVQVGSCQIPGLDGFEDVDLQDGVLLQMVFPVQGL